MLPVDFFLMIKGRKEQREKESRKREAEIKERLEWERLICVRLINVQLSQQDQYKRVEDFIVFPWERVSSEIIEKEKEKKGLDIMGARIAIEKNGDDPERYF
jgi:hypothetical protein